MWELGKVDDFMFDKSCFQGAQCEGKLPALFQVV